MQILVRKDKCCLSQRTRGAGKLLSFHAPAEEAGGPSHGQRGAMLAPGAVAESHPRAVFSASSQGLAWDHTSASHSFAPGLTPPRAGGGGNSTSVWQKNTGTNAVKEHPLETRMLQGRSTHVAGAELPDLGEVRWGPGYLQAAVPEQRGPAAALPLLPRPDWEMELVPTSVGWQKASSTPTLPCPPQPAVPPTPPPPRCVPACPHAAARGRPDSPEAGSAEGAVPALAR